MADSRARSPQARPSTVQSEQIHLLLTSSAPATSCGPQQVTRSSERLQLALCGFRRRRRRRQRRCWQQKRPEKLWRQIRGVSGEHKSLRSLSSWSLFAHRWLCSSHWCWGRQVVARPSGSRSKKSLPSSSKAPAAAPSETRTVIGATVASQLAVAAQAIDQLVAAAGPGDCNKLAPREAPNRLELAGEHFV